MIAVTEQNMDEMSWTLALAAGLPVGSCPKDNGPLIGREPYEASGVTWYESTCSTCGHEVSSPGGRRVVNRNHEIHTKPPVWFRGGHRDRDIRERQAGKD